MSDINWPSQTFLPRPDTDFGFDTSNTTLRTKFESGRTRQRMQFTKDFRICGVSWLLTDFQFLIFQSFLRETLKNGQEWFNIDLPQGDGIANYEARFVGGTFGSAYKVHMQWSVQAKLEIENPDLLSAEELELVLLLGDDLEPMLATIPNLHTLVHVTFPDLF